MQQRVAFLGLGAAGRPTAGLRLRAIPTASVFDRCAEATARRRRARRSSTALAGRRDAEVQAMTGRRRGASGRLVRRTARRTR